MTAPWQGQGADPWLPQRLAAQVEVSAAERTVYWDYWGRLSGWLTRVHRDVMRGRRPDPTAVWERAPDWAQAMADFTGHTLPQVMRVAYVGLFGEGFRFDARPAVAAHLAQVRNRMVRTPDFVFDVIAGEIATGAGMGESIDELRQRVDTALSLTGTERWRNRATVVARTETIGALNAGRSDAFGEVAEILGEAMEQMWLATDDERTRPTHNRADGQRVPLGTAFTVGGFALERPGDPNGPAHEVIQCRCSMLLVKPGETVDMGNRQYTGEPGPLPQAPRPPAPPAPPPPPVAEFDPDPLLSVAPGLRPTAPDGLRAALRHQNTFAPAAMELLEGVHLDNAGTWNAAIDVLRDRGVTNAAETRHAHAYYWAGDHQIHLAQVTSGPNFTAEHRKMIDVGWSTHCDHNHSGLANTLAHEFGHHVEATMDWGGRREIWKFIGKTLGVPMSRKPEPQEQWMVDNRDMLKIQISAYGSTSAAEMLAEIWAEYTSTRRPRPHIKKIGDKMKQLVEEAALRRLEAGGWDQ